MPRVFLEDKNQVVEIADGLTPQETEKQLRTFYTPEELYGATTFEERQGYRISKGRASVDTGKNGKKVASGQISYETAKTMNDNIMKDFTPENDEKYSAHNWPEMFVGATTELAPYMMDSAIEGVKYGEYTGAGFALTALAAGQAGPQVALPEEVITVPGAYLGGRAVGQAYGAWKNASDVEGGNLYMTLREEGIDHNTAMAFSETAGGLIGAIELFSVGHIFNKFIPSFGKKGITDYLKKEAKKEMTKKGSSILSRFLKKPAVQVAGKVAGRTALEVAEEQVQDNISFTAEVGAHLITAMQEEEGYKGPGLDDWVQTNKDTFTSSLLAFPGLMLPGATFDTIKTHGKEKIAQRIMTQRAQEALNLDLSDTIAEATKFDTYQDFRDSLGVEVDDKYANQFGFDNRTLFIEGIWNASRDVKGEDEIIGELVKEGEIAQPVADLKAEPTAKGGEIKTPTLESEAIRRYGITDDPTKSLYITTEGKYLGNRGFEGGAEHRNYSMEMTGQDRETAQLPLQTGMLEIVDTGKELNVRVFTEPTQAQLDKIVEIAKQREAVFLDDYVANYKTGSVDKSIPSLSYDKGNLFEFIAKYTKLSPKGEVAPAEGKVEKPKPSELISKEQAKGRVNKLIEDSNDLLKQIDSLERQKVRLEKAGKPVVALDTEISKLASQYDVMDDQIAEIMTTEGVQLSEEKIQLKARELEAIEKKIKKAAKSEAVGEQKTLQKEKVAKISETKQLLIDYANENLSKEDRGVFLTAVKNIKTEKQLAEQIARVNEYAQKAEKRGLVRQIKQQIKRIAKSKSISIDYVQKIEDFIKDYELKGHTEDTIKSLEATKAFIEKERLAGRNVEMPSYVLDALEILARKPLDELSSADLRNISDKIKVMADLGKTKLRSRKAAEKLLKARDLQAITKDSRAVKSRKIKEGNIITGKLNAVDNLLNGVKKALNFAQMKDLVITPMDAVFDYLDNAKNYLGANYRIFKRRIDVAYSLYLETRFDITRRADNKANELKLNTDSMERIGLYAAKVQKGGREKLLSFFTQEQIDSVILTDNEMEFYKFMRKELDNLRPQIEKVMREVYNQPLGEVENYFPFMIDFEAMSDKEIRDRFGDKVITHYDTLKKNVEMGFAKERIGGKNRIKLNAAEIFSSHVDNAAYLIYVGKETKYLGELARTEEYGQAVGDVGQEIVREWIDLIARKGQTQSDRIRLLDVARNYTGLVALGFKLSSALIQVTALMDGAALIGPYAFSGFKDIITSSEWRAFVMDNMPELRHRIGDDVALADFKKEGFGKSLNDIAYAPLKTLDKFTACGVAAGAYVKYCEENNIIVDLDNPNADAIEYAQKMMRRTQSSAQFKDIPLAISKGKLTGNISLDKIILQFQSFMLNRWSLIRHDLWRAGIKGKNKKQAVNIAMWLIAANFAELGIRKWTKEAIGQLMGKEPPEEDEDKEFLYNLGQILQNIPFVGSLYYSMLYGDLPVPAISMTTKITKKIASAIKADEDTAEIKWLKAFLTAVPGGQQIEQNIKEEE